MTTSSDLNNGASIGSANATAPRPQITKADLFPVRTQRLGDIENVGKLNRLQFPQDRAKYFFNLGISDYGRSPINLNLMSAGFKQTDNITLPMPQQMVDSHSVSYEQKAIGQFTGAAGETGGSILGMDSSGAMTNLTQSAFGLASQALGTALGSIGAGSVTDLARAATGMAPNQFLTVLLQGPQYKKYEFSWKLSPRNEAESEQIRRIVATLNKSMAPGLDFGGAFFTFPKIFKASFSNGGVLYRFKPSVLENMTVNYAPSGAPAFYNRTAAPDTVEVRLQFLEIEFWLKDDPEWEGTPISTAVQR